MNKPLELLGGLHGKIVHSRRVRVLAECFARTIPTGHRVLDFGCGDGLIDRLILEQRPDLEIRGVDVFKRPETFIPVELFDGKKLPFADQCFDSVIACDVLHHSDSPLESLREISRVARSRVILKDHFVRGLFARPTLRLMDFVGNAPHGVVLPYHYLTPREWDQCFAKCGLTIEQMQTSIGLYPWWANWVCGRGLHFVARLICRNDGSVT